MSFVSADTEAHWRLIEKRQGLDLVLEAVEGFEPTEVAAIPAQGLVDMSGNGGVKGKRPSKKDKLRAAAAASGAGAGGSAAPSATNDSGADATARAPVPPFFKSTAV